jgi:hypothetical protein
MKMRTTQLFPVSDHCREESIYSKLPLALLFSLIQVLGDRLALEEVHDRPLFLAEGALLRLIHYINWLRELAVSGFSNIRNPDEISEMAYGLTVAKFSELLNEQDHSMERRRGKSCRHILELSSCRLTNRVKSIIQPVNLSERRGQQKCFKGMSIGIFGF